MAHPREILNSLGANARKSLSQNFLTSPHWAETLTRVLTQPAGAKEYWEIGPGLGALTRLLLEKADGPVTAFEYDRKLSEYLRQTYPNLNLIEGDVIKADFKKLSSGGGPIAVLSNLPYHLSSPILFKLIEVRERILRCVLTFQKEFADRLIAPTRTEHYGALSVMAQLHFKIESIGILSPGSFYPPPAVASEALLLEPKGPVPHGTHHVSLVVKAAFKHPRKKMGSNLKEVFPTLPWEMILQKLGIPPMARAEELSKEQYLAITAEVKPYICEAICEK